MIRDVSHAKDEAERLCCEISGEGVVAVTIQVIFSSFLVRGSTPRLRTRSSPFPFFFTSSDKTSQMALLVLEITCENREIRSSAVVFSDQPAIKSIASSSSGESFVTPQEAGRMLSP